MKPDSDEVAENAGFRRRHQERIAGAQRDFLTPLRRDPDPAREDLQDEIVGIVEQLARSCGAHVGARSGHDHEPGQRLRHEVGLERAIGKRRQVELQGRAPDYFTKDRQSIPLRQIGSREPERGAIRQFRRAWIICLHDSLDRGGIFLEVGRAVVEIE